LVVNTTNPILGDVPLGHRVPHGIAANLCPLRGQVHAQGIAAELNAFTSA
jgi:hypothetical protein